MTCYIAYTYRCIDISIYKIHNIKKTQDDAIDNQPSEVFNNDNLMTRTATG